TNRNAHYGGSQASPRRKKAKPMGKTLEIISISKSHCVCCPPSSSSPGSCECIYLSNCVSKNNRFAAVERRDHLGCGNLIPVRTMLDIDGSGSGSDEVPPM